jgi:hypothetical protein
MGRTACTEPQCLYMGALYLTCFKIHNYLIKSIIARELLRKASFCIFITSVYLYAYLIQETNNHFGKRLYSVQKWFIGLDELSAIVLVNVTGHY